MPLTVAELSVALRLTTDPNSPPAEPVLSLVHRQLQTSGALVDAFVGNGNVPDFVRDEAIVRLSGYLWEQAPTGSVSQNPIRHSGALSLLSPYAVFGGASTATVPETTLTPSGTPETGLQPSHPVHPGQHSRYAGWSDDAIISQAELNAAARFTTDVLTVPARATSGYFFFGVEDSPGYPDSILLDGNPTNQITNFTQQGGTLTRYGESVVIGVSTAELSAALAGRMWTMGYGP